jgi:alpha/beta superfamily hydrolase
MGYTPHSKADRRGIKNKRGSGHSIGEHEYGAGEYRDMD